MEGALELWPVLHDAHQQIQFAYLLIWLKVCKVSVILWCQFMVSVYCLDAQVLG